MREGFYLVEYVGLAGAGNAIMALDTGIVIGVDITGGLYDGTFEWNEQTQLLDIDVRVQVPEGVVLAQGNVAPPGGLVFGVQCSFPRNPDNQIVEARTDFGPVNVRVRLLREFP